MPDASGRQGPILLVEDDETLAMILTRHLRARGYLVELCGSAEAALGSLRRGLRPSLVLLDINLPDATGWALPRSRELAAAGSPPVVVTTATSVSPSRVAEYALAGYLPKPFPLRTLMAVVERHTRPGAADAQDVPTTRERS